MGDDLGEHLRRPETEFLEMALEVTIDADRLSREESAGVDVRVHGLDALGARAHDDRRRGGGHERHKKRVAHSVLADIRTQIVPVEIPSRYEIDGVHAPQIRAQTPFGRGAARVRLARAVGPRHLRRLANRRVVDDLKHLSGEWTAPLKQRERERERVE